MTVPLRCSARSAGALAGGARKAKQFVDRGPHLVGVGPCPIADSTLSRTSSASATSGRSGASSVAGSSRCPNRVRSRRDASRVHAVSRLVPRVTSPPAHTRTTARSVRTGSVSVRADRRGRLTGGSTRARGARDGSARTVSRRIASRRTVSARTVSLRAASVRAVSADRAVRSGAGGGGTGVGGGVARGPHAIAPTARAVASWRFNRAGRSIGECSRQSEESSIHVARPFDSFPLAARHARRVRHVREDCMIDDKPAGTSSPIPIGNLDDWRSVASRRTFLRLVGLGGAIALLPSFVSACDSEATTAPTDGFAGSGDALVIDFAQGDVAILRYALVLEQVEADFYSRVVTGFGTSNITTAEQAILTDIRNHELAHREFLRGVLGADGDFTINSTFRGVSFTDRAAVLGAARSLEDLGVAAYNGAVQYLTSPANVLSFAKIVSVEA